MSILVLCSITCSLGLFWYSSKLDSHGQRSRETHFNQRGLSSDSNSPINTENRDQKQLITDLKKQVSSLKEELLYSQQAVYEHEQSASNSKKNTQCDASSRVARCQVLHIAIVCAGFKDSQRVVTLIKSILFYRKHPLHFHFVSDIPAQLVLKTLFETWRLQQVLISFYDTDKARPFIDWIPNRHYSGIYGLMKLTLTEILPESLDKIIVLDTDVFFLANIAELWSQFHNHSEKQAIGLVENQSKWYLGSLFRNYKPWPALGRGFNTGVILLDLRKLRLLKWAHLWRLTAEKELMNLLHTHLADQDIINAVIKENPFLVHKLPCEWNIQFSDNTQSEECYGDVTDLKIIHWNSPKKLSVTHKHVEYFRNMYLTFLQYDGNLLRRELFFCDIGKQEKNTKLQEQPKDDDPCYEYYLEQQLIRRVHLFYFEYSYQPVANDVTLVTHSSMDRLQIIETLLTHWEGPVSIALYASDAEAQQFIRYAQKSQVLKKRTNMALHLVYKDGEFYPVNHLRNVALEQAQTPYVFLSDIDFLPVPGLYEKLKKTAAETKMSRKAIVVPAFETFHYKLSFPKSKEELIPALDDGSVTTFRKSVWPKGHLPTDFEKWRISNANYKIKWQPDFEPYIMVEKKSVPLYDERFIGFGWNKVSHIMTLFAMHYEFYVAANVFIVHMPHAPSFDLVNFRLSSHYRRCLARLKHEFTKDLESTYSVDFS